MTSKKIQVVVAEDNPVVRREIRRLLNKDQDIEVVGEAINGHEALQKVAEIHPDLLLLDVEMPGMNGIDVARKLKNSENLTTRILVLSAYDDQEYIRQMLLNGASGYLLKEEAPDRIIDAVKGVAQGRIFWVSPGIEARKAIKRLKKIK